MNLALPLTQLDITVMWQEPVATDNSGEDPFISQTHMSGESFSDGVTTVSYVFSDARNNQAVCSFNINVEREGRYLLCAHHSPLGVKIHLGSEFREVCSAIS